MNELDKGKDLQDVGDHGTIFGGVDIAPPIEHTWLLDKPKNVINKRIGRDLEKRLRTAHMDDTVLGKNGSQRQVPHFDIFSCLGGELVQMNRNRPKYYGALPRQQNHLAEEHITQMRRPRTRRPISCP